MQPQTSRLTTGTCWLVTKLTARAINSKFSVFHPPGNPTYAAHGTSFLGMWIGAVLLVVVDAVCTNHVVHLDTG